MRLVRIPYPNTEAPRRVPDGEREQVTEIVPVNSAANPLAVLDRAYLAIEKAQSLGELKEIRDQAEAARHYVKAAKMTTAMANRCAEIRIRAERKAGEMIKADPNIRPGRKADAMSGLADYQITEKQSSRWQKIANIPEDVIEQYFAEPENEEREVTAVGLAQFAARQNKPDGVDEPIPPRDGKYRCIVIDPPWDIKKIEREERPNQGVALDYPTMSLHEIADESLVPVRTHADEDCHLYLWVTHKYLPAGLDLMEQWGFRYQCLMTWRKNVGITPFSWMYDTEHVIFGRKGNLPLTQLGLRLSFDAPTQGHSVKPEVFYDRVRAASPGPRIDMFARTEREGFEVWGNEVSDVV